AALSEPTASFSVGSRLLRLKKEGLLGSILTTAGITPDQLTVLDYDGLVNLKLTPSGLLDALGIPVSTYLSAGTKNGLVDTTEIQVADLMNATLTAATKTSNETSSPTANADIQAFTQLVGLIQSVPSLNIPIKLFGEDGVLAMASTSDRIAGLHTEINAFDIVSTTAMI